MASLKKTKDIDDNCTNRNSKKTTTVRRMSSSSSASSAGSTSSAEQEKWIDCPTRNDVKCGKDKTYNEHEGNRIFRKLIEENVANYLACVDSKYDKMQITRQIVETLQTTYNARFIKPVKTATSSKKKKKSTRRKGPREKEQQEHQWWCEISDEKARDKVSHALRFAASSSSTTARKPSATAIRPATTTTSCPSTTASPTFLAITTSAPNTVPVDEETEKRISSTSVTDPPMTTFQHNRVVTLDFSVEGNTSIGDSYCDEAMFRIHPSSIGGGCEGPGHGVHHQPTMTVDDLFNRQQTILSRAKLDPRDCMDPDWNEKKSNEDGTALCPATAADTFGVPMDCGSCKSIAMSFMSDDGDRIEEGVGEGGENGLDEIPYGVNLVRKANMTRQETNIMDMDEMTNPALVCGHGTRGVKRGLSNGRCSDGDLLEPEFDSIPSRDLDVLLEEMKSTRISSSNIPPSTAKTSNISSRMSSEGSLFDSRREVFGMLSIEELDIDDCKLMPASKMDCNGSVIPLMGTEWENTLQI